MEFNDFIKTQNSIYEKLRNDKEILEKGTSPNVPVQGGYLIVFRHPQDIALKVQDFTSKLEKQLPSIAYNSTNLHTTILDAGITSSFDPKPDVESLLRDIVKPIVQMGQPIIDYSTNWLYNANSVIIPGNPDEKFFKIASYIHDEASKKGIDKARMAWGSHITAARFTEKRAPKELEGFFELMKEAPILGKSAPFCIDVGYFHLSLEKFTFTITNRFVYP